MVGMVAELPISTKLVAIVPWTMDFVTDIISG